MFEYLEFYRLYHLLMTVKWFSFVQQSWRCETVSYTRQTLQMHCSALCVYSIYWKCSYYILSQNFFGLFICLKSLTDVWLSEKFSQPFDLLNPCQCHAWKKTTSPVFLYFFDLFFFSCRRSFSENWSDKTLVKCCFPFLCYCSSSLPASLWMTSCSLQDSFNLYFCCILRGSLA